MKPGLGVPVILTRGLGTNTASRPMNSNRLRAEIGYKRRYMRGGKRGRIAGNILDRNFSPDMPSLAWVSITYVRTYEGFLYVATVIDLFSRRIAVWSMDKNIDRHSLNHVNLLFSWFLVAFI
jgi:putative transposase